MGKSISLRRKFTIVFCLALLMESLVFPALKEPLGITCPDYHVYAADQGTEILIESEEDLEREAAKSGDGAYTRGKVFILARDLNFTGRELKPFQAFSGVFDGKGHSVKGLKYDGMLSDLGLFRSVQEEGEIRNLTVEAYFFPSSDMKNIGIIAGVNAGKITDCKTCGNATGKEATGGIAGRNLPEGRIRNCVNLADIKGMRRTGGIAGFNEGTIENSVNSGTVNAGSKTAWEMDDERKKQSEKEGNTEDSNGNIEKLIPDSIDLAYDDFLDSIKNEQEVIYTGGIAGVNSGTIKDAVNKGKTGYRHLGYKTGGIAGYERGIVDSSINKGEVSGRKNTGGIAGQFEPYIREDFEKDSFEKAVKAADSLVGFVTELQSSLKNEDDSVQERIDALRANADDIRGSIKGYKDYYRGKDDLMEADMRTHTSAIRDTLNGIDVSLRTGKFNDALTSLDDDIEKIDKLMNAAEGAASKGVPLDMTNYIGSVRAISSDINDQASELLTLAGKAGKEYNGLKSKAEALRDRNNSLDDFLRTAYDSYKTDIRGTDDDLTVRIDNMAGNMDALSDTLKQSDKVVRSGMDDITESLSLLSDLINEAFEEAREELGRIRDTKEINDIYDDISDEAEAVPGMGRITACENRGDISTDINGGGIAGMVDTDLDIQSDFEVLSSGTVSLKGHRTKLALISGCVNRGTVTVKNNCAGGIAGDMDSGAVRSCRNFGFVNSIDGDYAGGIAGKSGFMIRDSFSMASVSGNKYIGGIAGLGYSLINNRTLSTLPSGPGECKGAVAGDTDPDDGTVSGNIFVDHSLGAVNGLTFRDQARAVSYSEFTSLPGIPREAETMTVTFMSEGEKIGEIKVPYRGSVNAESFPELPERGGKFGVWEETEIKDVRQNMVINASFVSFVTTIASKEPFPVFLISGKFYNGSEVEYERRDIDNSGGAGLPDGYSRLLSEYDFKIISPAGVAKRPRSDTTIRLLKDGYGKNVTAALKNSDGTYTILPSKTDGRYLVFSYDCSGGEGCFAILEASQDYRIAAVILISLLLITIFLFFRRFGRVKAGGAKQKQGGEEKSG